MIVKQFVEFNEGIFKSLKDDVYTVVFPTREGYPYVWWLDENNTSSMFIIDALMQRLKDEGLYCKQFYYFDSLGKIITFWYTRYVKTDDCIVVRGRDFYNMMMVIDRISATYGCIGNDIEKEDDI